MTPLSFRAADGLALDVTLQDTTVTHLLGVLRISAPVLADKVEGSIRGQVGQVELNEDEVELLANAATVACKSPRVDDSELERIAALL